MNNSTKYIIAASILVVGVVGVSFFSCEKEEITPNEFTPQVVQEMDADVSNTERTETDVQPQADELISPEAFINENYIFTEPEALCGKPFKKEIMNPSGKEIGTAYIFNTDKNFYVWLVVNDGFKMKSASMHLGMNAKYFPWNDDRTLAYDAFKYNIPGVKEVGRILDFKIPVHQLNNKSYVAITTEFQNPQGTWNRAWVGSKILLGEVQVPLFEYEEQKCTVNPRNPGIPDNDNPDS